MTPADRVNYTAAEIQTVRVTISVERREEIEENIRNSIMDLVREQGTRQMMKVQAEED